MGSETEIKQETGQEEVRYTLWDRIVDFFYFNDYYIAVLIASGLLIYWALK